jgi:hypothetical protein
MSAAVATISATDVIEQIKKLSPDQLQIVRTFLQNGMSEVQVHSQAVEYITREEVEETAEEIFTKYHDLFKKLAQ